MPASRFTKKATTSKDRRLWGHVYDSAKDRGASPGSAVRQANAAIRDKKKGK